MHAHHAHTCPHTCTYTCIHTCTYAHTNTPPHRTRQRHVGGIANAVVKWAIAGEKGGRKERTLPQLRRGEEGQPWAFHQISHNSYLIGQVKAKAQEGKETKRELPAGPGKCVLIAPLMDSLYDLLGSWASLPWIAEFAISRLGSTVTDLNIRYVLPCSVFSSSSLFVPTTLPLTKSNLILSIQMLFC